MEIEDKQVLESTEPDWKNKAEYDYLKEALPDQFGWEFLRRNKSYQKDYEKYQNYPSINDIDANKDKNSFYKYYKCNPPNTHKESYNEYDKRVMGEGNPLPSGAICSYSAKRDKFTQKYDLVDHNDMSIYSPINKNGPGFYPIGEVYPVFIESPSFLGQRYIGEAYEDEIVVKLCSSLPFDKQLEKVKEEMQRISNSILSNNSKDTSSHENDKNLFITYLRILDALKAEATDEEIIYHVYYHMFEVENRPKSPEDLKIPTYSKTKGYIPEMGRIRKRFNENRKKAIEFRDGGYISLVKSVSHYSNKVQDGEGRKIIKEI